jgi:cytochrome c biogenesis protein CcmG/thiol:disulfide interchange protein DsbE
MARNASSIKAERLARARRATLVRRVQTTVIGVAVAGLLGFLLFRAASGGPSVEGSASPGQPAPEVEMTDFGGERFALADFGGTPVVLNFWASWCPNCVAEMPDFERVHQDLEGQVAFLGVNQRDSRSAADDLAEETGVTYRLARDPAGRVYDAFGGTGMPTTAFIDADGNVVDVVVGQLSESQLRDYIQRHFGVSGGA